MLNLLSYQNEESILVSFAVQNRNHLKWLVDTKVKVFIISIKLVLVI